MSPFDGVPGGRLSFTPLPNVLFSEVFPAIGDLAELKVTLHVLYLLHPKKGSLRFVTGAELLADRALMGALGADEKEAREALARALDLAAQRGTLLHRKVEESDIYLLNSEETRQALERAGQEGGRLKIEPAPERGEARRPNVFELYEKNIGPLTPMLAEELKAAEREYSADWIMDAFRIAVDNNVRKWSYVRAILEDWTREGKHEATGRNSTKGRSRSGAPRRRYARR